MSGFEDGRARPVKTRGKNQGLMSGLDMASPWKSVTSDGGNSTHYGSYITGYQLENDSRPSPTFSMRLDGQCWRYDTDRKPLNITRK